MPRHSPCALFCLTFFFGHYVGSLLKKLFFSLPQNCSISTQISEKLHLIFKNTFCCLLCCFLCFLFRIVQFSRYIFGLAKLKPFGVRLLPCHPFQSDWWAQMTFPYSNYRVLILSYNRSSLYTCHLIPHPCGCGGLKWTRTIDLALIRRAL